MFKAAYFLFQSELTLLWRRSSAWLYPVFFFLIVITLFPLALTPDTNILKTLFPGCLWIAALLANLLSVQSLFYADLEDQHLEQLVFTPFPLAFLLLIKTAALWVATMLPLIILVPLVGIWFAIPINIIFIMVISLSLGTPILTLIGCFVVALTLSLRQQSMLLGVLMLPLVVPVIIFGVAIINQAQVGLAINGPLAFLAALSLLTILLLPLAIAAVVKNSFD